MQRGSVLPLLLIIILVVLLGAAGVFYFRFNKNQTQTLNTSPQITPAPSVPIETRLIFGLEYQTPAGYQIKDETEEEYFKRANGEIRKNFDYYIGYPPAEFVQAFYVVPNDETNLDKAVLTVWVFQNPDGLSAEGFYDDYWYYPFVWGDFTARSKEIAPTQIEMIGGKEGKSGIVTYREGKPRFIYLPLSEKNLMLQIQLPTENNEVGQEILQSFKFE